MKTTDPAPNSKERNFKVIGVAGILAGAFIIFRMRYGNGGAALAYSWLAWVTLGCALQDAKEYRISGDFLMIGILGRGVILLTQQNGMAQVVGAIAGGPLVSGVLLMGVLIAELYQGRRLMGGGDIKLICLTGTFLGWRGNCICLLLACVLGIVYGVVYKKKEFSWGPCITVGAWIVMMIGEEGLAGI